MKTMLSGLLFFFLFLYPAAGGENFTARIYRQGTGEKSGRRILSDTGLIREIHGPSLLRTLERGKWKQADVDICFFYK